MWQFGVFTARGMATIHHRCSAIITIDIGIDIDIGIGIDIDIGIDSYSLS